MKKAAATSQVVAAVNHRLSAKWRRNCGVTDPLKFINEAAARIEATVQDMNHRAMQIQLVTMATAEAMKDDINTVAELSVNARLINPLTMRLRPTRAPDSLYQMDWFNVYRVARYYRKWPTTYTLLTDWGVDDPDVDCVASLLREDCVGLLEQRLVPPARWPVRLWLWRDQLWEAVRHDARHTPYGVWCWASGQRRI